MTVALYTEKQFFKHLEDRDCCLYKEHLDDRIVVYKNKQNGQRSIIQIRRVYYPKYTRLVCEDLRIDIPTFVKKYEKQRAAL